MLAGAWLAGRIPVGGDAVLTVQVLGHGIWRWGFLFVGAEEGTGMWEKLFLGVGLERTL